MTIIPEWRAVLGRAYSVHFACISFLLTLLGVIGDFWALFVGLLPIPPLAFAILGLLFGLAGIAGRFVKQPQISGGTQ